MTSLLLPAPRLPARLPAGAQPLSQHPVHLPQIVETQSSPSLLPRPRRRPQLAHPISRRSLLAAQVPQHSIPHSSLRHSPHLLLHSLQPFFPSPRSSHIQLHRIHTGEPSHRPAYLQASQASPAPAYLFFSPMSLHLHHHSSLSRPSPHRFYQSRQQHFIDLRVIHFRHPAQQPLRLLRAQTPSHHRRIPHLIAPSLIPSRHHQSAALHLSPPVSYLPQQTLTPRIYPQGFRPLLEGTALVSQLYLLPSLHLLVASLQVFQQDPPRHPIHRQMMDHQQQSLRPQTTTLKQVETEHWATAEMQLLLGLLRQPFDL